MSRTAPHKQLAPETEDTSGQVYPVQFKPKDSGALINDLGHYGGTHQVYRIEDMMNLELKSVDAAVRLAKAVNLGRESKHLIVRELLPDKDFVDQNGNAISGRGWRQPWSGNYTTIEQDVPIYKINRSVDYHNKVYCFWGMRYIGRGMADPDAVTDISSITIKDSVNTYDIWPTESLDVHREMHAFKPILIKNYTEFTINVRPKNSGGFDNIMLLGRIVEPRGETIVGKVDETI